MDSSTHGGAGEESSKRDAGVWCHQAQPECLVQRCCASEEKGWWLMFLYQFLTSECMYEERLLSVAPNTGGTREFSGHQSLFLVWI